MAYCPDCDRHFSENDLNGGLYCPGCGKALKCPECGSSIDAYAETCSKCGSIFSTEDGDYFDNPYDIRD